MFITKARLGPSCLVWRVYILLPQLQLRHHTKVNLPKEQFSLNSKQKSTKKNNMKYILVVLSVIALIFAISAEGFNKAGKCNRMLLSPLWRTLIYPSFFFVPLDCSLPKDVGPCRKADLSYYYDSEAKACQTFFYGGCHGNNNRFNSKEQCEQSCL